MSYKLQKTRKSRFFVTIIARFSYIFHNSGFYGDCEYMFADNLEIYTQSAQLWMICLELGIIKE